MYFKFLFAACFQVCGEKQRFEKLMEHFRNEDNNIDFMVSGVSRNSLFFFLHPFPSLLALLSQAGAGSGGGGKNLPNLGVKESEKLKSGKISQIWGLRSVRI